MDGINILNQTMIMETATWYVPAIIICIITTIVCIVIAFESYNDKIKIFGIITAIIFAFATFVVLSIDPKVETDRYRYEATVGDYIRFTDVYEKYDIVERRGDIWVLEDKENE